MSQIGASNERFLCATGIFVWNCAVQTYREDVTLHQKAETGRQVWTNQACPKQTKRKPPQQCRPSRTKGSRSSPERALSQAFLAPSLTPRKVPLNLTATILICLHQVKSSHWNNIKVAPSTRVQQNQCISSVPGPAPSTPPIFHTHSPCVLFVSVLDRSDGSPSPAASPQKENLQDTHPGLCQQNTVAD